MVYTRNLKPEYMQARWSWRRWVRSKKKIAYHGDTINIASRIEGKCNELGENLLISSTVLEYLSGHNEFYIQEKDEIALKGKQEKLRLYGIWV